MSEFLADRVKQLLLEWREAKAFQLGLTPENEEYCARNSIVLHDIYIDAIASNASKIHSVKDLRKYAYYWKWIDNFGQDLFATIREYLDRPKRCLSSEEADPGEGFQYCPKRVRTVL